MSRARSLSSLLDSNGDVISSALDNVPAADVVNDTTPQLGGVLDTNGNAINDATGVNLQYNGSTKLSTASSGVTVTGAVAATSFSGDGSSLTGLPGGGGSFYRMATGSYSSQAGSYVALSFTNADTSKPIWVDVNIPASYYLVLSANNASNGSFASNVSYGSNVNDGGSAGGASFNFASNPSTTSSITGIISGYRVGFWPTSSTCSFRFTRTAGDNGAVAYFSVHH